ncbi:DUF6065 family protein [Caulobacter endophyticus]|uniref:DUF6065 family protein n=1 Tax=Caulobacter endophyticus TaxID=2172652 RepID=UPI00240FA713|nr:DUF6065 family protein [Caulobacter endophyticus]MDG2530381.1 DUF6065 family protein [Caulobacter endophyticus]
MYLECYPTESRPPEIVPGRPQRAWMDNFADRHPYRCLPLTMANTTGWEILCPVGFEATWNGGIHQNDITFKSDHPHPGFDDFVKSHFSRGTITFHTGYLFRTPPDWLIWTMGPPNHIKDGIQPLAGLVETDWLPFPFTMNWVFTRPGTVKFAKGEPFCFITMIQDKPLETVQPVIRHFNSNPDMRKQYDVWAEKRGEFNARIAARDPAATKEAWQRFYFKGELPEEIEAPAPKGHVNKRRLKAPKIGF